MRRRLTTGAGRDIVLSKMALTEKKPQKRHPERGAYGASALCRRRLYHSRAAREDRDGPARYSGHKRREVTLPASRVEPWSV